MNTKKSRIAFIGGGNMAQAIISGLISAGHEPNSLIVTDPNQEQRNFLSGIATEMQVHDDNMAAAESANVIVLAVKPQIIADVAKQLGSAAKNKLVVSIAAGTTLDAIRDCIGAEAQLVRVMPNQPALIGQGMSGLCAADNVSQDNRELAAYVMQAAGEILWFEDESQIDSVTAISGSGPAYFYLFMEIMQEVAEEFGFDSDTARLLSVQTAIGAGQVAGKSDESLAQLRERVTSPGGTTAAALSEFEAANIRAIFRKALYAARDRSIELGQPKKFT
jgi:pyrroline-5-carboxylate reductase